MCYYDCFIIIFLNFPIMPFCTLGSSILTFHETFIEIFISIFRKCVFYNIYRDFTKDCFTFY